MTLTTASASAIHHLCDQTTSSQYHVHRYTQAKITLFCCTSTSLCVARCCVAVCDDTDDVAYSSSYVYPVLAVSDICADYW